ncbi:MAG: hypothetical protein QNK23_09465 [Crocinitomicaceae bacterium]|nr:hypothetical protein [Crocinitomicaceae bacterium]
MKKVWISCLLSLCACAEKEPEAPTLIVEKSSRTTMKLLKGRPRWECLFKEYSLEHPVDSIVYFDERWNLEVRQVLPISSNEQFSRFLKYRVEEMKMNLIQEVKNQRAGYGDEEIYLENYFFATPISLYQNDTMISCLMQTGYYVAPSVHGMSNFLSLNYDVRTERVMNSIEFFVSISCMDTTMIINLINRSLPERISDVTSLQAVKYNFDSNYVYFNFDPYEITGYSSGPIRGRIALSKLK